MEHDIIVRIHRVPNQELADVMWGLENDLKDYPYDFKITNQVSPESEGSNDRRDD